MEATINFAKTVWQWINRRVCPPYLDLVVNEHLIKRTSVFKYLGNYVDERLSFSQHGNTMFQKIQNNARLLKYVAHPKTSSMKAINLIFQMIYAVWPLLSNSSIDFFRTGQMQPTMKYGGFQISRQRKQRHSVSSASSSIKPSQHRQYYSMTTSSAKPCACICNSM